jgi:hypothetical protein
LCVVVVERAAPRRVRRARVATPNETHVIELLAIAVVVGGSVALLAATLFVRSRLVRRALIAPELRADDRIGAMAGRNKIARFDDGVAVLDVSTSRFVARSGDRATWTVRCRVAADALVEGPGYQVRAREATGAALIHRSDVDVPSAVTHLAVVDVRAIGVELAGLVVRASSTTAARRFLANERVVNAARALFEREAALMIDLSDDGVTVELQRMAQLEASSLELTAEIVRALAGRPKAEKPPELRVDDVGGSSGAPIAVVARDS